MFNGRGVAVKTKRFCLAVCKSHPAVKNYRGKTSDFFQQKNVKEVLLMYFFKMFQSSFEEMKNLRSVSAMGMLLAVRILLSVFVSVPINESLRIGTTFIATAVLGMLYGPVAAAIVSGAGDIIQYILKPTGAYFPGWTISAALAGMIYGIFLYKNDFKKPINFISKIIIMEIIINVLINSFLGTYWLKISIGIPWITFWPRFIKNIALLPIEAAALCIFMPIIYNALNRAGFIKNNV